MAVHIRCPQLDTASILTANIIHRLHFLGKTDLYRCNVTMEVALTFGSLGDIVTLCQLAIQLGRAVAAGQSAREYQDLRRDLDLLVQILLQLIYPLSSVLIDSCFWGR